MGIADKKCNKGEWAELYVMFKLLGEGRLYAADSHLRKKPNCYLEVLSIIREEVAEAVAKYNVGDDGVIEVVQGGLVLARVPSKEFLANAHLLFEHLEKAKGASVGAPERVAKFADRIFVTKPKSPSVKGLGNFGGKTDITIRLHDSRTSMTSIMGFSIKSQFAQAPTLFNAGTSSQLLFWMQGMDDEDAALFNSLVGNNGKREWSKCVQLIADREIEPTFIGTQFGVFRDNLLMIRESMAGLLACMYREALLVDRSCVGVKDLCDKIAEQNPLDFNNTKLYEKAIKDFLFASFAGMTAGRSWDGEEQVNGGYIVVLPDGEVLCYHANDRERFRDYLLENTFVEYVSCKKYHWGFVSRDEEGRHVLPVNASIRFYKDVARRSAR